MSSSLFDKVRILIEENKSEELIQIFKDVKGKLSLGKVLSEDEIFALVGSDVYRDHQVECYFPEVVRSKKCIALSSLSTGDCLFSSVSLSLYGNNRYCDELRLLACIDIFLNARYYANHPVLNKTYNDHKDEFSNYLSVFTCSVSDKTLNAFEKTKYCPVELCKKEAFVCCEKRAWSSFITICALTYVLGRCISTFYPDKGSFKKYIQIFNDKNIFPRGLHSEISSTLNILFCRSSALSKSSTFAPNHFCIFFVNSCI